MAATLRSPAGNGGARIGHRQRVIDRWTAPRTPQTAGGGVVKRLTGVMIGRDKRRATTIPPVGRLAAFLTGRRRRDRRRAAIQRAPRAQRRCAAKPPSPVSRAAGAERCGGRSGRRAGRRDGSPRDLSPGRDTLAPMDTHATVRMLTDDEWRSRNWRAAVGHRRPPDGGIYTANAPSDVSVVDTETMEVIARVPVGRQCRGYRDDGGDRQGAGRRAPVGIVGIAIVPAE